MPLPVAHSLLGATICVAADRDGAGVSPGRLATAVVLANAADLDYLPGMLIGDPHRFHRMASHSLTFAVLVGIAAAIAVRSGVVRDWPLRPGLPRGALGTGLIATAVWMSHPVLDLFNGDYSEPTGVLLFWPFLEVWVASTPFFMNVDKVAGAATPWAFAWSLVTWHNVKTAALEFAVLGPVLAATVWWRRRGRSERA